MRLLTKEQARELDRIAINKFGIPGVDLMGKAGAAVAEYAQNMIAGIYNPNVAIICGKGNNAGDGYKAALELHEVGIKPQIFIIFDKNEIKGDSLFYYKKCVNEKISITHSNEPPNNKFDLIIDAIFGTGFSGELRTPVIKYTQWINDQNSLVLSIDIPSGVDANNGVTAKNAIIADNTITMGMTKLGMMVDPGKSHCGGIIPADIGFPDIYDELPGMKFRTSEEELAYQYLNAPDVSTYKHKQGKVLIIAGSRGMTGAAILATHGAIRSGAGLVTTCAPQSLSSIYETNIIEGLTVSCIDDGNGYFIEDNYTVIEKYFKWSDSILIGPGLGKNVSTINLVKKIIMNYEKPIIIDADALHCFNGNLELYSKIKSDYIITPHHGELANLLNINI